MRQEFPPSFDKNGYNVVDPNDKLGHKTDYLTRVQKQALVRYAPKTGLDLAVDVGCGFGRLTPHLKSLGYARVIGIDPDPALLSYARKHFSGPDYLNGTLPNLPIDLSSANLIMAFNLFRGLKIMNTLSAASGIDRFLAPNGTLLVVDNIWPGNPKYWELNELVAYVESLGFSLEDWWQIRQARQWRIHLIRYGLISESHFHDLAENELNRLAKRKIFDRWQYTNTLFLFKARR